MEDQDFKFVEESHQYFRKGIEYTSVSTYIKNKFSHFDADKVSKDISNRVYSVLKDDVGKDNKEEFKAFVSERTKEKFIEAQRRGVRVHDAIDKFLKGKGIIEEYKEAIDSVQEFMDMYGLTIYESEMRLYDDDTMMAGTIDAVFYNAKGDYYVIVDWKYIDKLTMYGRKCRNKPFVGILECKFAKYSLQLQFYKYMFEKRTGFKVRMCLIVVPSKAPIGWCTYDINTYDMEKIISYRIKEINQTQ